MLSQAALEHLLGNALPHAVHAEQIVSLPSRQQASAHAHRSGTSIGPCGPTCVLARRRESAADPSRTATPCPRSTPAPAPSTRASPAAASKPLAASSPTRPSRQHGCTTPTLPTRTSKPPSTHSLSVPGRRCGRELTSKQGNLANQEPVEVFNPVNEAVRSIMQDRKADYSSSRPISIWVGTYNVNGRSVGRDEILRWICPTPGPSSVIHLQGVSAHRWQDSSRTLWSSRSKRWSPCRRSRS